MRVRRPEWKRHPKGGQPYKRAYGEPEDKAQSAHSGEADYPFRVEADHRIRSSRPSLSPSACRALGPLIYPLISSFR